MSSKINLFSEGFNSKFTHLIGAEFEEYLIKYSKEFGDKINFFDLNFLIQHYLLESIKLEFVRITLKCNPGRCTKNE